jgi:hypothetical protein
MSLLGTWAAHFQSKVRMRGRAYHDEGRVTLMDHAPGQPLCAEVRGSELYTVTITDDGTASNATCTCPHFAEGAYCKHIWATLLEAASRHELDSGADADAQGDNDGDGDAASILQAAPPPPRARKRASHRSYSSRSNQPDWSDRLSLLYLSATETDDSRSTKRFSRRSRSTMSVRLSKRLISRLIAEGS